MILTKERVQQKLKKTGRPLAGYTQNKKRKPHQKFYSIIITCLKVKDQKLLIHILKRKKTYIQ